MNFNRAGIKKDDNGLPLSEENFEEAIKAVNFAITPSAVPEKIIDLLSDERCINLTTKVNKNSYAIIFTQS